VTGDIRKQLIEALDAAEVIAQESSRDLFGEGRTVTGEHWRWECSNCDTPIEISDVVLLDELLQCPSCESVGVGLRSIEEYRSTVSSRGLAHLVTHSCEEIRPVDALHIARWDPSTVLRLIERDRQLLVACCEVLDSGEERRGSLDCPEDHSDAAAKGLARLWLESAAALWLGTPEVDR
jgi:hypothetical protein